MLGRLFSSASSTAATSPSGTRPSTSHALESDELHTRNLLYPDSSSSVASSFHSAYSLAQSQSSASSFGYGDIDLEASRDVRVIIAQDAIATEHKLVIYDSKPSAAAAVDENPTSPTLGGPYGRSRRRNSQFTPHATGPDDELRVFTDCMFGVAPLSYKGPSTKVHILPNIEERRPSVPTAHSALPARRGSLRDGFLSKQPPPPPPPPPPPQPQSAKEKRKSVLITRLFSVVIPPCPTAAVVEGGRNIPKSGSTDPHTSTPTSSVGSTNGFPFPRIGGQTSAPSPAPKLAKPSKQSMYAIGLIIALPPSAGPPGPSFPLRCCHHKPMLSYDSDFPHRHEYCCPTPPNYDEEYPPLNQGLKTECALNDLHTAAAASDGRMDLITKHWDVITRALSDLQRVAQARILENLTTARLMSPQPVPQNGMKYLSNRCELRKMAMMHDDIVRTEVERLRWRVVSGIKMPRVVVGQGRWEQWQVEARWANHRFGGRDMNLSVDRFRDSLFICSVC
jgi:hypothetical protein